MQHMVKLRAKARGLDSRLGAGGDRIHNPGEKAFEIMITDSKRKTPFLVFLTELQCWRRCRMFSNESKAREESST